MKKYTRFITYEFECSGCGALQDVAGENLKEAEMTIRDQFQWKVGDGYTCPNCWNNK